MKVAATSFKSFQGKVKAVNKKEVAKGENFSTPPCEVLHIPEGTVYYEIILEKGASKQTLSLPDKEILKSEVKLMFFEDPWGEGLSRELDRGKSLKVGKNYCFSVQSWQGYWVSDWKEN